jgi:hypothetical protein
VVREAAPTDAANAELRLAANAATDGVSLFMELVRADGTETKRVERLASRASALAQARAMARELLKPAAPIAAPPPTAVEVAQPPTPPRPAVPRPPPRFVVESTAFAGLFWMGDVKKPTGGLDFGIGWQFRGTVGVGLRLALAWVELDCSCYDGDCGPIVTDSERENDLASAEEGDTQIKRDITTTLLTLLFDLRLGNTDLFFVSLLAGVRTALAEFGMGEWVLPIPYVALGLTLTPLRHERVALLLRIDVGYYTAAAIGDLAEGKGLEPRGAVGIQF